MTETSDSAAAAESNGHDEGSSGLNVSRMVKLLAGGGILIILGLLIFALVIALTAAETWRPVIQIFRDIFVLALILELLLIILALAVLMLQAAAFIIMLKAEIKPILENARKTTQATQATARFVSQNAVDPLIQVKSFLAGLRAFIRELIRLRSALQSDQVNQDEP